MSPPLREPDSVGCTTQRSGAAATAAARNFTSIRSRSASATSSSRVTLYIAKSVHVVGGRGERPGPVLHQFADPRPPLAQSRIRPTFPGHVPPRLCAGKCPRDGDGVDFIVEPNRRADQHTTQGHAAVACARSVFGEVTVDESPGATRAGNHTVDHEHFAVSHEPTV